MQNEPGSLGMLLKNALTAHSYSLRYFAELTSIDKATISRIINGKRKPTLKQLKIFSSTLKVPLNELIESIDHNEESKPIKIGNSEPEKLPASPSIDEIELLEQVIHLHDQSITVKKVQKELERCQDYAGTDEGNGMIKEGFEAKVNHFGNAGTYIDQLKGWHLKLLKSQGTKRELAIIGGALLYFVLPLDLLHDYVFAVGYLDDCMAIQLASNRLENNA